MSAAEALKLIEQAAAEEWTELDLSGMNLDALPPAIGKLAKLETLILGKWNGEAQENNLKTLPPETTQLQKLKRLEWPCNNLEAIPVIITKFPKLKQLNLSFNQIKEIPESLSALINLQQLDLSANHQIKEIPDSLSALINLQQLDLSANHQIKEIPDSLAALVNLQQLQLGGNPIKEIPYVLTTLVSLQQLHLNDTGIKEIPDSLAALVNLQQLYLYNNQIKEIPDSLAALSNLQRLQLNFNRIKKIPDSLAKLASLQQLDLNINQISEIPDSFATLKNLQKLDLGSNQIKKIPDSFGKLASLQQLNLGSNQIKKIPDSFGKLASLQQLNLSHNKIEEIPDSFATLVNLQQLYLYNNPIKEVPDSLATLVNLQQLGFSSNQIKEIPDSLATLVNLQQLDISSNQIKEIPDSLAALTHLQNLGLSSTQITEIPDFLSTLVNLQQLNLSFNQIKKIPDSFVKLASLQALYLCSNQITKIPSFLENLPALQKLDLRLNPIPVSPEILGSEELYENPGSVKDIFNYLHQLKSGKVRPLNEAKLILVGQGSVGKTSLINRLLRDEFDKDESQTDGLNVQDWAINVNSKDIRLNVWDFGGQEIYHATHQFFLTKRSLYLLVCNCRTSEEENRLEYWLKLIQTFGDASPVIIVGNKKDEQPLDINRKALQEKYPNIRAILETSCQSGDGIKELSEAIHQEVAKLKEVYDLLPLSWFEVKEQLEAMTEDFISYNRYIGICHENKIPEEQNQEQLIDLLHRLGLVLNFREHPLLQQTNVLKPEWATEGIYALLSDDHLKTKSKGIFCCDDLTRILDAARYPKERHQYLIELMKEFELSFALDCNPPRFLIPSILPKDEPEATDLRGETLEFQYHYRVLPNSIISRFIVNTHEKIHNETYWRSGVMLAYSEGNETCNIARVKADPEDNKIFIAISGKPETRRTFLGLIRDVFKKLHKSFGNLEISEWVPVPGHPEHAPLDYQELLGLEAMGETEVTIGKLRLKLELRKLLDGYESIQQRQQARNKTARIDKQYNFYSDVNADFYGGSKMTGDQPNISINADNIGIASMSGGTIESGAIVAGQYNEASNDLEDLLKLIALMKEAVQFFPEAKQEDITIDLDDMETEVKKPKDKRRIAKIRKCLTALATAGTVAIASLGTANEAVENLNSFVDNANTLANKFQIELPIAPPSQQP